MLLEILLHHFRADRAQIATQFKAEGALAKQFAKAF
jgi:hypothetical protein